MFCSSQIKNNIMAGLVSKFLNAEKKTPLVFLPIFLAKSLWINIFLIGKHNQSYYDLGISLILFHSKIKY